MPALYIDPLREFLGINPERLLGRLTAGLAKEGFDTTTLTTFSWLQEIADLQLAFRQLISTCCLRPPIGQSFSSTCCPLSANGWIVFCLPMI